MSDPRVPKLEDIPPGTKRVVDLDGQAVVLCNVDGVIHAVGAVCPHRNGPLGDGMLKGKVITCPWHGWQFDVTTGECALNANFKLPCYRVRQDGDAIHLDCAPEQA